MQAFNGSLLVFKAVVLVVIRPSTRPQLSFFDSKAHGAACIPNESARHHPKSNTATDFSICKFLLACLPPPLISNDHIYVNNLEPGCANAPIKIYDGNSDEAVSTVCIDPSLRRDSPDLGAGIPTPGLCNHATAPVNQTAPPGLIPTQPPPVVEPDIPVPHVLNKPGAPPAYAAAPVPRPSPAPVFPNPSQLPAIPPVSNLALQSYIRYATGQPQVEDSHLRAYKSPSPILVSDIPERREPPG
ncbi:hypothetical protein PCASD_19051 [Puccinia coronata f. sp. avenae]|uniref:Uncharacterized protein n=1 Tax=Puccinia coronata f. sp. avenae TaxID=200324 RepID=A0A2N5TWQ0_9BASI|nr:hypothetical protein PCASD_19051 [Puccinia coronata f. sp. avenae]